MYLSTTHVKILLTIVEVEGLNIRCLGFERGAQTIIADILDPLTLCLVSLRSLCCMKVLIYCSKSDMA